MEKYKRLTIPKTCNNCDLAQCTRETFRKCVKDLITFRKQVSDMLDDGTLVELPCKVGDIVYRLHLPAKEIKEWEVLNVVITKKTVSFDLGHTGTDDYSFFYDYEFGTYYFLDKSQAEAKLKELKGETE